MTRIASVRVEHLRLPFTEVARFEQTMTAARHVGLVRLATDDGREGVGEIAGLVLGTPTLDAARAVGEALAGCAPDDAERIGPQLAAAAARTPRAPEVRAAIETATLDLEGQVAGRPLADLLGGGARRLRVNGLLLAGGSGVDVLVARARSLVESGVGTLKIKRAPGGADVADALLALRDAVGPGTGLRLDLNGDLDEPDAIAWLRGLERADLEYVEQPIPASLGPAALARVRRGVPMPIAADEAVTDADAVAELLRAGACDVLVVKPARVGGPRQAHRIAVAAAEAGVGVTISTFYETGIGLAAAAHVAATVPGEHAHGIGTAGLLEDDLVGGAMTVSGGWLEVPQGPGIGVTLDERAVDRYRLA